MRLEYLSVIEQSRPMFLTKIIGTPRVWIMAVILIILYGGSTVLVVTQNLFSLDPVDSRDHFLIGTDLTNKFFADDGILHAFEKYKMYAERSFRDP